MRSKPALPVVADVQRVVHPGARGPVLGRDLAHEEAGDPRRLHHPLPEDDLAATGTRAPRRREHRLRARAATGRRGVPRRGSARSCRARPRGSPPSCPSWGHAVSSMKSVGSCSSPPIGTLAKSTDWSGDHSTGISTLLVTSWRIVSTFVTHSRRSPVRSRSTSRSHAPPPVTAVKRDHVVGPTGAVRELREVEQAGVVRCPRGAASRPCGTRLRTRPRADP